MKRKGRRKKKKYDVLKGRSPSMLPLSSSLLLQSCPLPIEKEEKEKRRERKKKYQPLKETAATLLRENERDDYSNDDRWNERREGCATTDNQSRPIITHK